MLLRDINKMAKSELSEENYGTMQIFRKKNEWTELSPCFRSDQNVERK